MSNKAVGIGCLAFLLLLVVLLIIGLIVGDNNPQSNFAKATPTPEDYRVVNATDLAESYRSNEVLADKRYDGDTIFVVGKITDIGKTITGAPYAILEGNAKNAVIETSIDIQVIFERSETDKIAKLYKGATIKAKATCNGLTLGNVVLSNGELR